MVHVVASIQIAEGRKHDFIKLFEALMPLVHQEQGCVEYFPAVDVATELEVQDCDANCVTILEKWQNLDALKAHLAAPHMDQFRNDVEGIVDSLSMKILQAS